jgi:DNA repair exonuclease SbcCD ATPase subunit
MMVSNAFVPESITIKNFSNIANLHVDFPDILVITGKNGSGKSSVIDAFFYCIAGKTTRDVQIDDIIKKGEKSAVVKVVGTYNGERVEITRTRSSKQKLSVLVGNDKKEEPNPEGFLESIVTPGEFLNLFLVDGHNIARFMSAGAKEMSANIDKLFNFGKLDSIIREMPSISGFEKDLNVMDAKIETLVVKKDSLSRSSKITGKDVFENRLAEATKQIPLLQAESKDLSSKIQPIQSKVKECTAILEGNRLNEIRRSRIVEELKAHDARLNDRKAALSNFTSQLELAGGESAIASIGSEITKLRQIIASTEAEFSVRKDFPALLKKAMESAPGGNDCPMCATPGARDAAEKNLNVIASGNKDALTSLLSKKVKAQKETAERESTMKSLVEIKARIVAMRGEIDVIDRIRSEKAKELEPFHAVLPDHIDKASAGMKAAEQELASVSSALSKTNLALQAATRDADDARRSIEEINSAAIEEWNDEKESELAGMRAEKERCRERIDKLVLFKGICRDVLSNIRDRIMATLTPNVMECIKNFGGGESAITKFEIVPKPKTVKGEQIYYYDFAVEVAGNDVPFDALSTGQKALVVISIILSMINYSSSALSCIFFDEIDNCGLDRNYMQTILKAIVNMTGSIKVVFVNRDKSTIDSIAAICTKKNVRSSVIQLPDPVATRPAA